jgi:hypothetical protein
MGHIDVGRTALGAVIAAIILYMAGFVIHGIILVPAWEAYSTAMGDRLHPLPHGAALAVFAVVSLINGTVGLVTYVGLRPRFGAGPHTALLAGLMLWAVAFLTPALGQYATGIYSTKIIVVGCIGFLIAALVAVIAGAFFYREHDTAA